MGAWGTLSSPFRKRPGPSAYREYQGDPYFEKGGEGMAHAVGSDEAAYGALMKYMAREPGYTPEEQKAMYDQPADQSKVQEQTALRRLSTESAGSGGFGSGAATAGRGAIIGGGIAARAGLKQNVMVQAAQAALEDRLRQIQAAQDYSTSRLGMVTENRQGRNAFNMGLNNLDMEKWKTLLSQYNFDRQKTREFVGKIVSSIGTGGGG